MTLDFSTNFPILVTLLAAILFFCREQVSQLILRYTLFLKEIFFVTFAVGALERSSILDDLFKYGYLPKYFYRKELIRTDSSNPLSFFIPLGDTFLFSKKCFLVIISKLESEKSKRTEISFFRLFVKISELERIFTIETPSKTTIEVITYDAEEGVVFTAPKKDFSHLAISMPLVNDIIKDIDSFNEVAIKNLYQNLGIPYKKSYLLCGSPGYGKSTFIKALATYYDYPIYSLKLDMSDSRLLELTSHLNMGCIVVIEEIDSYPNLIKPSVAKKKRTSKGDADPEFSWEYDSVTLSGYNQAIDALGSNCNTKPIIFIITTNYPERLIDSVIRKGRIDKTIKFIRPTDQEVSKYLELFSPYVEESLLKEILTKYSNGQMSPAELEEEVLYAVRNRKCLNETES